MRVRLFALLSTLALFLVAAVPASASSEGHPYLALGDSVAFGTNPLLDSSNAGNFTGYPSIVAQQLNVEDVNVACPGEATGSFISLTGLDNVCRGYRSVFPLHTSYSGTQLAFATNFLKHNPRTRLVTFGLDRGDYRVEGYRALSEGGSTFSIRGVDVTLNLGGRHQALNAAAALAASEFAGVPLAAGAAALGDVRVEHRMEEKSTPAGYTIIDDAYNASPESMLAAFDTLAEQPRTGRLLAVLGEMRELGSLSEAAHRRVGQRAAEVFDAFSVVDGSHARAMAQAGGGEVVADRAAAAEWVKRNAVAGDRLLVKASHGLRLDQLVEELTAT